MALLPIAAALLVTGPAPDALTPAGPATLRGSWLGASPSVNYPPRVVVRWRVHVGEGGAAGPVALRVLHGHPDRARGRGRTVQLPAAPGTYEFPARLRFFTGDRLGLDQEAGGHAIVHQHRDTDRGPGTDPYELHALDVWRPPLAVGQARERDERVQGAELLVVADLEEDFDSDGYGNRTQDENDLEIVSARTRGRTVRVRVRNRGSRTVDQPRLLVRVRGARLRTVSRGRWNMRVPRGYQPVDLDPIGPRRTGTRVIRMSRSRFSAKLIADSEGFDPTRSRVLVRAR